MAERSLALDDQMVGDLRWTRSFTQRRKEVDLGIGPGYFAGVPGERGCVAVLGRPRGAGSLAGKTMLVGEPQDPTGPR